MAFPTSSCLRYPLWNIPRSARAAAGADRPKREPRPRPERIVPFLREWLVAGPYPSDKRVDEMLAIDHIRVERALPGAGKRAA